jgi:hypothetical protein
MILDVIAELDGDAAQDQQPQHDHQGQIESAEAGGVERREREIQRAAAGQQPHFVAVPHRTDDAKHPRALAVGVARGQEMQIPVPISKPSKITYMAIATAINQNQSVSIALTLVRPRDRARSRAAPETGTKFPTPVYRPMNPIKREPAVARRHLRRRAIRGAHQAIDQPRLAAHFGGHPAGGGGDVGKRQHQHQQPQHVTARETACRASSNSTDAPMPRRRWSPVPP